jgi:hypothetical protein
MLKTTSELQDGPRKSSPSQGQQHAIEDGQRGGGGEMLTARMMTNCSITQRNILTPERISQGHVQMGGGLLFHGPPCSNKWRMETITKV